MPFKSIINQLTIHTEYLFLLDGTGAFITGAALFGIVNCYQTNVGMPSSLLFMLSGIVAIYAMYAITCHVIRPVNVQTFIMVLAIANLIYCGLTLFLVAYHFSSMTWFGLSYFLIESVVITSLVYIEFAVCAKISS